MNKFVWTWVNPFRRTRAETRSGDNYDQLVAQALHDAATGATDASMPGSVATAAGFISRGFSAATVTGPGAGLYPATVRSRIAWDLASWGDSVWQLRNSRLRRVPSYALDKGVYRTGGRRIDDVVHFRVFTADNGRGFGVLQAGANLYKTAHDLERSLRQEAKSPTGHLLPIAGQMDSKVVANIRTMLTAPEGRTLAFLSGQAGYGQGSQGRSQPALKSTRIGPTLPTDVTGGYAMFCEGVLAALGVPPEMLAKSASAGVIRDAWRQLSYGCLTPMAMLIEEQSPLTISFDFSRLMTGDSAGAARAFRSLVEAGLSLEEAAANTGVVLDQSISPDQRHAPHFSSTNNGYQH